MRRQFILMIVACLSLFIFDSALAENSCDSLHRLKDVTIIYTDAVESSNEKPAHCYAKGLINGSITFHIYLPSNDDWNGRLVHFGDGGADVDLDYIPGLRPGWRREL